MLVVLHLAAIAYYAVFKRDNLVRPMVLGDKAVDVNALPDFEPAPAAAKPK